MKSDTIDAEWTELVRDDGTVYLEKFKHSVIIGGENSQEIASPVTSISYSPTVNKVKKISVDVPPDERLEDLTYLGEELEFYINGEFAFSGKIKDISTSQDDGEDYSLTAYPPADRLSGSTVERSVDNEIISDSAALIVDRFNSFDGEHENLKDNAQLNNIQKEGGGVFGVSDGSQEGTIVFESVGNDISDVERVYFKTYTPSDSEVTISIVSDSHNISKTVDSFDKNVYGEWGNIEVDVDSVESYDIEFSLTNNSLLINWISVNEEILKREVEAPDIETIEENFFSYSIPENVEDSIKRSGEGVVSGENSVRTRQVSQSYSSRFGYEVTGSDEYEGGEAQVLEPYERDIDLLFSEPDDPLEEWSLWVRVWYYEFFIDKGSQHHNQDNYFDAQWSGDYEFAQDPDPVKVDDESIKINGETTKETAFDFYRDSDDINLEGSIYLDGDRAEIAYVAGPLMDENNLDGYGFYLDDSELSVRRFDDGSDESLNSTSVSLPNDDWVDFTLTLGNSDIEVFIEYDGNSWSTSSTDEQYNSVSEVYCNALGSVYLDDFFGYIGGSSNINSEVNITVFDNTENILTVPDTEEYRQWQWLQLTRYDASNDWNDDIPIDSTTDFNIELEDNFGLNTNAFIVSGAYLTHKQDRWSSDDFDLQLQEPEGYLKKPYLYASGDKFDVTFDFEANIQENNVTSSEIQSTIENTNEPVSDWGVRQTIDVTEPLPNSFSNSDNLSDNYSYPGVSHQPSFSIPASGSERTDQSPTRGYKSMELVDFDVYFDFNDLEIIFDESFGDNRLSEMNSLASDSSVLFRWEGDLVRIFHQGQKKTDINLRSETIKSSVNIEDVYNSCEVVGVHNVRSGIIESEEAPDFVDEHMQIRSEDVTTKEDAVNRARRFLENHGTVKYKGKINTAPTFAPVGEVVDGSLFNHGQDMIIRNVRYSKSGTTINFGFEKNITGQILSLSSDSSSTKGRATDKGMTVPVGEDQL